MEVKASKSLKKPETLCDPSATETTEEASSPSAGRRIYASDAVSAARCAASGAGVE